MEAGEGEGQPRCSSMAGNCSRGQLATEGVGVPDIPGRISLGLRRGFLPSHWLPQALLFSRSLSLLCRALEGVGRWGGGGGSPEKSHRSFPDSRPNLNRQVMATQSLTTFR